MRWVNANYLRSSSAPRAAGDRVRFYYGDRSFAIHAPLESNADFAEQLLPYLLDFDADYNGVWRGAKHAFLAHMHQLEAG